MPLSAWGQVPENLGTALMPTEIALTGHLSPPCLLRHATEKPWLVTHRHVQRPDQWFFSESPAWHTVPTSRDLELQTLLLLTAFCLPVGLPHLERAQPGTVSPGPYCHWEGITGEHRELSQTAVGTWQGCHLLSNLICVYVVFLKQCWN